MLRSNWPCEDLEKGIQGRGKTSCKDPVMERARRVSGNDKKYFGVGQKTKTEMIFKIFIDWYKISIDES